jgi:hypothetical protein
VPGLTLSATASFPTTSFMDARGNTNGSCTSTENMQQRSSACSSGAESDDDASRDHLPPVHGRTGGPTRRSSKGGWTPEEDEVLRRAVQLLKGKNWKKIGKSLSCSSC